MRIVSFASISKRTKKPVDEGLYSGVLCIQTTAIVKTDILYFAKREGTEGLGERQNDEQIFF